MLFIGRGFRFIRSIMGDDKPKKPTREGLLKMLGDTVKVIWRDQASGNLCGMIGWLFRVDDAGIRLKITATRHESYASEALEIEWLDSVVPYEWN